MADEANIAAPVEAPAPATTSEPTEPTVTNGESAGHDDKEEGDETAVEHTQLDGSTVLESDAQEPGSAPAEPGAEDTPASAGGKDKKRKSTGGVPEHKNKKNKKKNQLTLHLDCKPGEFYWARLKGYPPWPAIICDEDMLPETLLATRPVSTARPDGSIRDDFKEGGKNAKERTFPIMFLSTNEFQWMVNTNLKPLDPKECEELPKAKMTRALQDAYKIAAQNHGIDHFKNMLTAWQEEQEEIRREMEAAEAEAERIAAERAARAEAEASEEAKEKKKKAPRKSKGADTDVDMDDTDAPKSSKKRKKDAESDAEGKPKKTPKVTKLNGPKTPNGEASASKKSTSKPKKKVVQAPKPEEDDALKPQLTEAEKLEQRQKAVLYLRHRLQKGFLARDQAPQESEMPGMSEFFTQLEAYENLEPSIIRETKIHKVLKAIVKLASVPKDEQYNFKKRSSAMLDIWNKRMESDGDAKPAAAVKEQEANGEKASAEPTPAAEPAKPTEEKAEKDADDVEKKADAAPEAKSVIAEAKAEDEEKSAVPAVEKEADGDVSMRTAPEEATA